VPALFAGRHLPARRGQLHPPGRDPPRPLAVARDEALPLYIQARGAKLAKTGEVLEVTVDDEKVQIGSADRRLPGDRHGQRLHHHAVPAGTHAARDPRQLAFHGGWFMGHTVGTGHKNVEIRTAQYKASFENHQCLHIAKGLVEAKIQNCRTLLRRNWKGDDKARPTCWTACRWISARRAAPPA
jgi:CRISP-associated protein Cas1